MSGHRAGEERQPARSMPLPLCLLLLLSAATAALPLKGRDSDGHTQEVAEIKKNSLLTFLAWWYEWTSQAGAAPFMGGEAREVSKRQGGPPPQQSTPPEKVPCKNFFWKTFSSCK
ncbi:PREDICTED: cortistatin-like [Miniopterus natalensis]|uniref:cortistatin-like n=1 Tax=Miniopterus natalensis TaxID=291302 RepID=UPI0007A6D9E8|nr:PREDICTED: cortistatin-like [Miniopterus natalensis]